MPKRVKKRIKRAVSRVNLLDDENDSQNIENSPPKTPLNGEKTNKNSKYFLIIKPKLKDIEKYHRCGVTESQLCEYFQVSKPQWIRYKKEYPEFLQTLNRAKNAFKVDIINRAYEIAMGVKLIEITEVEFYVLKNGEKVVTGGKTTTVTRETKPDVGMLQFLLINRFQDDYMHDPQTVELKKKALELAEKSKTANEEWEGV